MKVNRDHSPFLEWTKNRGARVAAYLLPVLTLMVLQANALVRILLIPLKVDPLAYCAQIEGTVTTWWSALFMHECRVVLYSMRMLFGDCVPVEMSLFVVISACLWMMCASIMIFLSFLERRSRHVLVPSCVLCVAALASYVTGALTTAYLDAPGTAILFSSIVLSLILHQGMNLKRKVFICLIVVALLLHACSFRSPFLLLSPFVLGYMVLSLMPAKGIARVGGAVLSTVFFLGAVKTVGWALPESVRTYPMYPMIESDLHIASIFRGDGEYSCRFAQSHGMRLLKDDTMTDKVDSMVATYGLFSVTTEAEWETLCKEYYFQWKNAPRYMVEARLHQMFSFLTGEYFPNWYKQLIHCLHPHVMVQGVTLGRYHWPDGKAHIRMGHLVALLVWVTSSLLPVLVCAKLRKHGEEEPRLLYLGVLCLISLCCYLTVVVPTADFRYRIHTLMIGALSLGMCWSCLKSIRRIRAKVRADHDNTPA